MRVIRGAVNKADNEQAQESALAIFVRACLQWILDAVEFFTRFTSNFAAITGESFCTAASMTYDLLKRNMLSTVLVEVISDRLLAMVTFVLSVVYAVVVSHIAPCAIISSLRYRRCIFKLPPLGEVLFMSLSSSAFLCFVCRYMECCLLQQA